MKIENIDFGNFDYEDGLMTSENLNIRNINQSIEIWINTEDNSIAKITEKQFKVFKDFTRIDKIELLIQEELRTYYQELLGDNVILKSNNLEKLTFRAIIIPKQNNTKDYYLFILADTNWKIMDSEYPIELEIMFKNNTVEFLQEYSGLWTRIEWDEYYNK